MGEMAESHLTSAFELPYGKSLGRPGTVDPNPKDSRIAHEIIVRRENRYLAPRRDRADQDVYGRPLNPFCPAPVRGQRRVLIVGGFERDIWKGSKVGSQILELSIAPYPGEQLLANKTQHEGATFLDEVDELRHGGVLQCALASKG